MKNRAYNDIEALALKIKTDSGYKIANVNFGSDFNSESELFDYSVDVIGPFYEDDGITGAGVSGGIISRMSTSSDTQTRVILIEEGSAILWIQDDDHLFDLRVDNGKAEVERGPGPDGVHYGWTIYIAGDADLVFYMEMG